MSKTDDQLVLVGRISSVFGIKGWVNVYSYTDPAENILNYSSWLLCASEGDGQGKRNSLPPLSKCKPHRVSDGQRHGKRIIAQLDDNTSRERAGEYVQQDIFVKRGDLPALDDDVYWIELEGLQVVNLKDQVLGRVERLFETGANDVLVVKPEDTDSEQEYLIPYVEEHYVIEVDLTSGTIQVDWELED